MFGYWQLKSRINWIVSRFIDSWLFEQHLQILSYPLFKFTTTVDGKKIHLRLFRKSIWILLRGTKIFWSQMSVTRSGFDCILLWVSAGLFLPHDLTTNGGKLLNYFSLIGLWFVAKSIKNRFPREAKYSNCVWKSNDWTHSGTDDQRAANGSNYSCSLAEPTIN